MQIEEVSHAVRARVRQIEGRAEVERLSQVAGCTPDLIYRFRLGTLRSIGFEKILRLAQHFGIARLAAVTATKGVKRERNALLDENPSKKSDESLILNDLEVKLIKALRDPKPKPAIIALLQSLEREITRVKNLHVRAGLHGAISQAAFYAEQVGNRGGGKIRWH